MAVSTLYHPDPDILSEKAADQFLTVLATYTGESGHIKIALSGGSSLLGFYHAIIEAADSVPEDLWKKLHFCLADERLVPKDHRDSNYRLLDEVFFSHLTNKGFITGDQILSVDTTSSSPAGDYSRLVPKVDIALLGAGPDGHITSLFPHHPSIDNEDPDFILVKDSPKPPPTRISMSPTMVRSCSLVFLFFISEKKREAYQRFLDPVLSDREVPCKLATRAVDTLICSTLMVPE